MIGVVVVGAQTGEQAVVCCFFFFAFEVFGGGFVFLRGGGTGIPLQNIHAANVAYYAIR